MGNASKEHPLPCSTLSAQLGLPQSLLMLRLLLTVPLSPHSPFLLCMSHLHHSLTALPAHSCLLSTLFFTDVFLNKSFAHVITFCLLFPGRLRLIQCQSSNSYLIYRIFFFLILREGQYISLGRTSPRCAQTEVGSSFMLLLKYHEYKFETINLFQKQIVGCSSGKVCRAKFKCHCRLWKFSLTEIAILFFRNSMKRSLKNASAINHRITSHNSWNFC